MKFVLKLNNNMVSPNIYGITNYVDTFVIFWYNLKGNGGACMEKNRREYVFSNSVDRLLELIQNNQICLGERLPSERMLSQILQVGRGSIREALRALEQRGYIQQTESGSRILCRVSPPEEERNLIYEQLENAEIENLWEVRETLDDKIVELACLRATGEDLERITAAHDKVRMHCLSSQIPSSIDIDMEFHLAIAEASHNSVFESFYRINLDLLSRIRLRAFRSEANRREILAEHTAIYDALVGRDALSARLASHIHYRNGQLRMGKA